MGAGIIGDPVLIPELIELMRLKEVARAAGEAFSSIVGVDIEYNDLDQDAPEDFEGGPGEAPEDQSVDLDPDEDLPWPDPELVAKWWRDNKNDYKKGTRYLQGQPIDRKTLETVLRSGKQRQRHAAALELAIQNPRQPIFEVRAPGKRQTRLLNI